MRPTRLAIAILLLIGMAILARFTALRSNAAGTTNSQTTPATASK